MRRERPVFARNPQGFETIADLLLECHERLTTASDAGPEESRPAPSRECPNAFDGHRERRKINPVAQNLSDLLRDRFVDVTDEANGEMHALRDVPGHSGARRFGTHAILKL